MRYHHSIYDGLSHRRGEYRCTSTSKLYILDLPERKLKQPLPKKKKRCVLFKNKNKIKQRNILQVGTSNVALEY